MKKDKQLEEVIEKQARFEQLIQSLIDSGHLILACTQKVTR